MVLELVFSEADSGLRAVDALRRHYNFSNRRIKQIKFHGYFKLNQQTELLTVTVKAGDVAEIVDDISELKPLTLKEGAAQYVIFQNRWFVACNKPAGMLTHPNFHQPENSLSKKISDSEVHLINRLDKDSSGLVLLASNAYAHALFAALPEEKYYLTCVYGQVEAVNAGEEFLPKDAILQVEEILASGLLPELEGTARTAYIAYPICRREGSIIERRISSDKGKNCLTFYRVLGYNPEINVSLLLCRIVTGRTHQIRLHCLSIGHPLLGETLYDLRALAEMAKLPLAERHVSFKKEIGAEEQLKLDELRFSDNPLSTCAYRRLLSNLLELPPADLSSAAILTAPLYRQYCELNQFCQRQFLHSWCLKFADPLPQAQTPTSATPAAASYCLFASPAEDMQNFLNCNFPQQAAALNAFQKTHFQIAPEDETTNLQTVTAAESLRQKAQDLALNGRPLPDLKRYYEKYKS